jgi:tellurite resistance protein TerA
MSKIQMIKGQKVKLQDLTESKNLNVGFSFQSSPNTSINLLCFGLDLSDKLSNNRNVIFKNQNKSQCGSIQLIGSEKSENYLFQINLNTLDSKIYKLAFVVASTEQSVFSQIQNTILRISQENKELANYKIASDDLKNAKAILLFEIYLKDIWRISAVGNGYNLGLNAILNMYGADESLLKELTPPASSNSINLQKVSGNFELSKGKNPILIEKTTEIIASISWRSGTDYDIYALVITKDGRQIDVSTFGANGVPTLTNYGNGTVQHMGDVTRDGGPLKTETIKIRLNDNILAVIPVAYSAQSNGHGSFHKYEVSMSIDNQNGTKIIVPAKNAKKNPFVYTCVPGMIKNTPDGVIIEYLELYSRPFSENRPNLVLEKDGNIKILMDKGPRNDCK